MSLQVWLPLNGNLNNQGLSNVTVTNHSAAVDNNGKIGKCYRFETNSNYITLNKKCCDLFNDGDSFSYCFWIKISSYYSGSGSGSGSGGTVLYKSEQTTVNGTTVKGGGFGVLINQSGNATAYANPFEGSKGVGVGTIPLNTWTHICMTYDKATMTLSTYLNGSYVASSVCSSDWGANGYTFTFGRGTQGGWANTSDSYQNDIRIYDHCLSPKEVKEISKGLVLHYKLDNIPNKNLVSSLRSYSNDSYNAYQFNLSENFVADETYTFQLWDVDVSHSGKTEAQLGISVYWGGGSVSLKSMNGTSWFTNGHADYIKFSITITSSQASGSGAANSWINIYNSVPSASGEKSMHIGAIKIERGSNATEYTPYNEVTTQAIDSSGYSNHGTITGSLMANINTPKYLCSTNFATTGDYISRESLFGEVKTMSIWCYIGSAIPTSSSILFADYNSKFALGFYSSGTRFITSCSGTNFPLVSTTNIKLNSWNHIAIVAENSTHKTYINGILQTNDASTNNWTHSTQTLMVASRSAGNGFVGLLSDFRVYATALSADDIKELYDTSAFIDNIGNLECYKISEEDVSSQEVMQTGVVKTPMFIESNERLKVLDDGSVWLQILHHNNPAQHLFTRTNCWFYNDNENLFSMLQILKDEPWITSLTEFEFLACEKLESSSTEKQYRWKQTSNPATSTSVTGFERISGETGQLTNGLVTGASYGCFDISGSSWWCCCGSYTAYSGGTPGFGGVVKSGYMDLYIKIPFDILNGDISEQAKFFKKSIVTNQLLEI